jgi:hypothetical protein
MGSDQASPAAANSQPIGLAGRRSVRTSPMVAKPRGKTSALTAPSASTATVSGRITARVTTSPPAQQPNATSHSDQASTVVVRGCRLAIWS